MATKVTSHVIADNAVTDAKLHSDFTATTQSASDNSTNVATTAYVTTAIANLSDSAPSTLNTLNELAAALGDDANYATTTTNAIAAKAAISGQTFTGDVQAPGLYVGSTNTSYDFYNNGTSYFNGAVTVDDNLTTTGDITISNAGPSIYLVDTDNNPDYQIKNGNGAFRIIDTTNSADRLHIDANGKVGIGTTSPDRKLHINESASGTSNFLHMTTAATGASGSNGFLMGIGSAGNAELWNYEAQPIIFATSSTERMRIDSSGKVGIGITNPSGGKLEVSGGRAGVISSDSSWGQFRIGNPNAAETSMGFVTGATASDFLADGDPACSHKVIIGLSPYGAGSTNFGIGNDYIANYHTMWTRDGHQLPRLNNTYDLGSTGNGFRNIYTNDLNLSNMPSEGTDVEGNPYTREGNEVDGTNGSWTIQEGSDDLYLLNRLNGKKYKFKLEEVS